MPPREAYIGIPGSGTVVPFNTVTKALGSAITVGGNPDAIAILPNGATTYVTDTGGLPGQSGSAMTRIATANNSVGGTTNVGPQTYGMAVTPDGKTAYVTSPSGGISPIDLNTNTVGATIPVSGYDVAIAITPDGHKAYVTQYVQGTVTPVDLTTKTAGTPIPLDGHASGVAITPDGKTAYVGVGGNEVVPIAVATNTVGTAIPVSGSLALAIAITPNGKTAYVASSGGTTVTPINLATNTASTAINVSNDVTGIAVNPSGTTVYVATTGNVLLPIKANTVGTPITLPGSPGAIAFVPDQAPIARFTATAAPPGQPTHFDASTSAGTSTPIASYRWDFGDGTTTTTKSPQTAHAFTAPKTYTVRLTVTDTAGTSTTKVFTGQTMSRNGLPRATTTRLVPIA